MRPAHDPFRRRLAAGALLAALLPALAACAADGGRTFLLPRRRLDELLARQFPYTRGFGGLAELTLRAPRLTLLPASNRLATAFELEVAERLTGRHATGALDLDYALRFDPAQGAIRMADVRVNRLELDQLPPAQRQLVSRYAPRLVEQLLADLVIHRFPPEQLATARDLGLEVAALRVLPEGLQVELAPPGAR